MVKATAKYLNEKLKAVKLSSLFGLCTSDLSHWYSTLDYKALPMISTSLYSYKSPMTSVALFYAVTNVSLQRRIKYLVH